MRSVNLYRICLLPKGGRGFLMCPPVWNLRAVSLIPLVYISWWGSNLGSLDLESDAQATEPPRHPSYDPSRLTGRKTSSIYFYQMTLNGGAVLYVFIVCLCLKLTERLWRMWRKGLRNEVFCVRVIQFNNYVYLKALICFQVQRCFGDQRHTESAIPQEEESGITIFRPGTTSPYATQAPEE